MEEFGKLLGIQELFCICSTQSERFSLPLIQITPTSTGFQCQFGDWSFGNASSTKSGVNLWTHESSGRVQIMQRKATFIPAKITVTARLVAGGERTLLDVSVPPQVAESLAARANPPAPAADPSDGLGRVAPQAHPHGDFHVLVEGDPETAIGTLRRVTLERFELAAVRVAISLPTVQRLLGA